MKMPFTGGTGNLGQAAEGLKKLIKELGEAEDRAKKLVVLSYDAPFQHLAEANIDTGLTKQISNSVETSRAASQTAVHQLKERVKTLLERQVAIASRTADGH